VSINTALEACRQQPDNFDELTTIRRGFHTLKGSGRMVGLMSLGEIAWEIEQVMNRQLEQKEPATPALLELITSASASFVEWIGQLRENKPLVLHAEAIVELARKLKAGEEAAAAPAAVALSVPGAAAETKPVEIAEAAPAAIIEPASPKPAIELAALGSEAVAAPEPAPEPEEVTIGDIRLARSFFEIYIGEAAQHISALEAEYGAWRRTPGAEASHGFLRAAHTLASSSRTAGFTDIADLAATIEHWLPFARQTTHESDAKPVQAAIGKLRDMVDAVTQRKAPKAAKKEARRVDELTARLQATPPPPIESKHQHAPVPPVAPKAPAPPAAAPVATGMEQRSMRDDIDAQLLPIFLEEAQQLLPQLGSDLRDLKANPADQKVCQSLMRVLHTFKGSSRMAGAIRLGELTHLMESRLEAAIEANQFPAELFEDLESKMDRLSLDIERMQSGEAAPAEQPAAAAGREAPARVEAPLAATAAMLRVNADKLDHLINESGEVSIARSRIEAELRGVKQALSDLNDSISRLRTQLREVEIQAESQMQSRASVSEEKNREFDPLEFDRYTRLQELTRMMAESLHDATSIQQALLKNVGETDAALLAQARTSRDVQQELMRMRAVPFSNLDERLYRIVRQVARELDKKAELVIEGSEVELDRSVIEKIGAPLEHMLRNSLGHGLEPPARRIAEGKPETGRITITLRQESNEIALIFSDDGAGLDLPKLHKKAVERGILEHKAKPTEAELMQLVFASGLSTAETVTELSGRGVGMDVVKNEIAGIGGRIDIATTHGKGTTFTVYLPLTLAVTQVVLVRSGGRVYAISSAMVEQVQRVKSDALAGLYEKGVVESQSRAYPMHYLQHLLGVPAAAGVQNYNSVLLLRSGIQRVAVHVDELLGNQEIVVKNIGPQLSRVPGVAGATVLADGRIALIINPVPLALRARAAAATPPAAPEPVPAKPEVPMIMVVDDSLTVRKITSRLLEREGYQVLTAKDGVDALEQIRGTLPDVMLVDIEMPRMDGFELTKNVRADPRTHGIPIIVITSRTADKHRDQAERLGVNGFLGKPYQEADLLDHVSRFLSASKRQALVH
jgi:chemosensory pili system protein ChpA (sensor histidine kinase/response regulator)